MLDPTKPLFVQKAALNQLRFTKEHCEQWIALFAQLLQATREAAPARRSGVRADPYGFNRLLNLSIDPRSRERLLEQAIWLQWGRTGSEAAGRPFLGPACRYVQAYQVPLQDTRNDEGWGKVDLMGVSDVGLPVVAELKRDICDGDGTSCDRPLWALAEALGYAIAIQRAWVETDFRREWAARVPHLATPATLPATLVNVPVLIVAPESYWRVRIGSRDKQTNGRVPPEAWPPFLRLVRLCCDSGYDVHFVTFDVTECPPKLPKILNPRLRPLPGEPAGKW